MILYHGSNVKIEKVDLLLGHLNKDFGQGFYLTDIREQAEAMAKRKALLYKNAVPQITEFIFDEESAKRELKIKIFDIVSEEWAEFIYKNRNASVNGFKHDYDIVYGPIADDGVVLQLNLYEQKYITIAELVKRLEYKKLNNQYYFGTEKSLSYLKVK